MATENTCFWLAAWCPVKYEDTFNSPVNSLTIELSAEGTLNSR